MQTDDADRGGRANALGDFLRSRRARLVDLPAGRRRTPGLRREEVAERAGIGVDWYTRLEQGRSTRPSPATVDALARALQLDRAEHAHLRALVRGAGSLPYARETVPPTLKRIVAGLRQPAYVLGRRWDVLAWNAAAARLLALDGVADADRNVLVLMLTQPRARQLFGAGWAAEARRMLREFRATHDLWAADPAFTALIERLDRDCPEFGAWWRAHDVARPAAGRKLLHDRRRGTVTAYAYASFQSNDDASLKLVLYAPVAPGP